MVYAGPRPVCYCSIASGHYGTATFHLANAFSAFCQRNAIILLLPPASIWRCKRPAGVTPTYPSNVVLATEPELSNFLKEVEKRAFKRTVYHVRDEEAALDIVQDSMMKLAQHYGDKPVAELPMLFHRILSNCTLDWFRRQKTRNAIFTNMADIVHKDASEDEDFDWLQTYASDADQEAAQNAETLTQRAQLLQSIEKEIQALPARQREAFLLRYWEDMDVAETAAAMGCSEGSVKTHCFRAVQALSKALKAKGIEL